ncbi:vegetative incompatibility protein HET-E-1 [Aspergillus awamori]|uniref:Vegetative incompatibility protein HET-E-1 n=1 Tax=Aspergillus awamori TaxID=105351 RepID=A0A401L827_ASPAW|nr:vegetative incompatibility protein HET-E-1 [Aspergillus awamori]
MEDNEESEHYEESEDSEDSDLSNGQPEENYIYLDDLPTLATCYLYVIIVPGDGELKHWILYIDAPTWTEKPMVHLVGSPTYYRVEARFLTRNDERRIIKRVNLCDIPNAQNVYDDIIDAGEWAEIDNQDPSYNSQIYILELLDDLEHRGIVSMNDPRLEGLWKKAYSDLRHKNPDLLAQYEKVLLSNAELDALNNESQGDNMEIDPRLESCVKRRLEAIEKLRCKIRIGGKEIEVRKQVRHVLGGILSVKDIITAAVSAEPHVSIAWAGVLFLLYPLAKSFDQDEDAMNGFQAVSDLMVRSKTVELYVLILEYHMSLATHFDHAGFRRFLHDWTEIDKWHSMLKSITSLDESIVQYLATFAGDDIQKILKELENSQRVVMDSLSVIKENVEETKQIELLKLLPLVEEATFGSLADQNKPECLEGTQTKILREIQTWVESPDDSQVFWLRGMAGTGKSTISRTFAAACQQGKSLIPNGPLLPVNVCLGASFFFDRTKSGRNSVEKLFPSISNKLAHSFPDSRDKICQAILDNQSIGNQNLHNQWSKLISEPLLTLDKEFLLPVTLVLVLDALDESVSQDPKEAGEPAHDIGGVLRLITTAEKLQNIRLKIFLTSRPEIRSQFYVPYKEANVHDFELRKIPVMSEGANLPKDDITFYLEHQVKRIVSQATVNYSESPAKSTCWLSQDEERKVVRTLAEKSDGLFIYAATACRFLDGVDCDFDDLQARMREISGYSSEVDSPQDNLDQMRCLYDEFCIDPRKAHRALFESCLRLLSSTLKQDICSLEDPSFLAKDIGSSLLDRHVPVSLLDNDCVHEFLKKHFLCWLEVMSLLRMIPTAIVNTIELESYFASLPRDGRAGLQDMVSDMKRFILASKNEIENAPLQVYRSALIFAPKQSICRKTFQSLIPRTFSRLPKVKEKWDPLLQELDNREPSRCLAISSDGKTLAILCGRWKCLKVKLWSITTGTLLYTIDCGGWPEFIAFLPGDKHILSFGDLEGVRVWDIGSGILLRTIRPREDDVPNVIFCGRAQKDSLSSRGCLAMVYPSRMSIGLIYAAQGAQEMIHVSTTVNTIAWSADGATLAISLTDGSITFWDANWRDCQSLDSDTIWHFSPSEDFVTTWHRSIGLQRWDCKSGQRLVRVPTPLRKSRVELSPNGKLFVVATVQADRTPITELFDSATGELLTSLRGIKDHPSFAFTSESRILVSADIEGTVRVWDLSSDLRSEQLATPPKSGGRLILSHDHQFALSASPNHIYLWENRPGSLMRVVNREDTGGIADMFGQVLIRDYTGPILTNIKTAVEGMKINPLFDDLVVDLFQSHFYGYQIKAISSNGRLLAKASVSREIAHDEDYNDYITVWDVITGDVASTIPRGYNGDPYLSFSPDVQGDFRIQRDTGLHEELEPINIHWSANGTNVAIDCFIPFRKQHNKASIFLYDLAKDNSVLLEYPGSCAALSPDQRLVATRDFAGRILYLWENVGDNLTLLGQHNDMNSKWSVVGSKMLKFEGDEVFVTRESRIDVKSFLPNWDSRTSRQIQVKNDWIIYGNESGEVTFWEFADEEES